MKLHCRQYSGAGSPVVILHGLYGNHGNWAALARQLAEDHAVYAFDARNHGQSPWADSMSLHEMAADVFDTMQDLRLHSAHLLGHSMGGKTAMLLALQRPEQVRSLVVVDIAPVDYHKLHDGVLQGLLNLDLVALQDRAAADVALADSVPEKGVRDFLLANLQRDPQGGFRWRINLPVISRQFLALTGWEQTGKHYDGPVLFLKGANSPYILPEHEAATLLQFPEARMKNVAGAGHWVHAEKPEAVLRLVRNFLKEQPPRN